MSAAGLQFACLLVSFAMCYDNGVASREHFAATLAATQDAAALAAVAAELEAMAVGLMPAQATAEAVRQAVDEARRLAQGIERDAELATKQQQALTRSARLGGAAAAELALFNDERLDARIARLADVLRGNYAAEKVHCINWAVVGHFEFADDDCDAHSATIDRALAAATAMQARLLRCAMNSADSVADAEFDDLLSVQRPVAVMRDAPQEPPEQPRAATAANPLEAAANVDDDADRAKRRLPPPSMAFGARPAHSGRLEAADVEAGRIRLVRSVGGTVAVAGPLDEDASPQAVAVAAVCAAAFAAELSAAAAETGLTVAGALVAEECAGALLGQGAMRYGVHGVATTHAAAVACAAETLLRPSPMVPAASSATVCTSHFVHELADGVQLAQVAEARAAAEAVCPASGAARVRWYLRDAGPVDGVAVVSRA